MIGILITLLTYILMEGITWCTHKFVMHGLMWYFHEDHHQPRGGFFEKNDAFFLIFAVPSCLLIVFGSFLNILCILLFLLVLEGGFLEKRVIPTPC